MRPVPISDDLIPEGAKRFVIGPPDGDLTNERIRPVEAVAALIDGEVHISMLVALEDGDIERLQACGGMWLTMITTQIPPFMLEIADGQG